MPLKKGTVQSFDGTHAVIVPNDQPEITTKPLIVPFIWRKVMGNLHVGEEVYYMEDNSHEGVVISRTDGAWDNKFRGELEVTGDVTAAGTSLKSHTHTGNMGNPTSTPNA